MTFKQWLRNEFAPEARAARAARASRRGKSRQPSGRRRVPRVEFLEDRRMMANFTVTSLADSGAGTLRAAIHDSVNNTGLGTGPGADTIQFSPAIDGGTISLSTIDVSLPGHSAFMIHNNTTLVIDGETGLTQASPSTPSASTKKSKARSTRTPTNSSSTAGCIAKINPICSAC